MISINKDIELAPLRQHHITSLFQLVSNPMITQYMRFSCASSLEEAQEILDMYLQDISYAIIDTKSNDMIGVFSFKRSDVDNMYQLSAFLEPACQGKGYMKAIFANMIPYAYNELHAVALEAYILDNNKGSCHLVQSHDFQVIKRMKLPDNEDTLLLYRKEL